MSEALDGIAGFLSGGTSEGKALDWAAIRYHHTSAVRGWLVKAYAPATAMYAGDRACVNTMEHANDLCDELGSGVGIAVDVYHVWWDPQLKAQIECASHASEKRILALHVGDWLIPTIDLSNDRGMMGDGVIDIRLIRSWVEAAGYCGPHEVEIFSTANWWKREGDEVLAICKERHRQYV